MTKPSHMNRNIYPASYVDWCQTLDKEVITCAILESTTQVEFHTSKPVDDSGKALAQEFGGLLEEDKTEWPNTL